MSAMRTNPYYGDQLVITKKIELGSCYDVALEGKTAYIIGGGSLYVADAASPGNPEVIGKLSGLGSVRQIAVQKKLAYITSRADGVFIADAADPERPVLLCHYDSVELATGIAVSGNLLFVANRDFGVEIIDVSDPGKPVHLSTVLTGEAQSVYVQDNYLFAGVWAAAKLVIVDISDPRKPEIIAKGSLDGFGDGVCVRGDYAYAATGHHQPSWLNTGRMPESRGYGQGHGLEIFDISNHANPVFLSGIKFPAFYNIYPDTWKVMVSGKYAFCADSYNGIFAVDIGDPLKPAPVACRQLDYNERHGKTEPVVGLAVADGYVYAAGYYEGIYVMRAEEFAKQPEAISRGTVIIPAEEKPFHEQEECRIYKPDGQVYAVSIIEDDICVVAAGRAGFKAVRLWPEIKELFSCRTAEIVFNVQIRNNYLYVSEGMAGFSVWEYKGKGKFIEAGRYASEPDAAGMGKTVKQALVGSSGRFALLQIDCNKIEIVDLTDLIRIRKVMEESMQIMYGDQAALVKDRYACAYSHITGLYWYDLESKRGPARINGPVGKIAYRSGIGDFGEKLIIIDKGKYKLVSVYDNDLGIMPDFRIDPVVSGNPSIFNNLLFISNRREGRIFIADISDIENPKMIRQIITPGNPGRVVAHRNALLIPDGYEGLRIYDNFFKH